MTFDHEAARAELIAMRVKHGADTEIGHRCSNLIEQLDNYQRATALDGDPFMTATERGNLKKLIEQSIRELNERHQ